MLTWDSVIPQDPTLFSGDLRSNLDPFGQFDDARLWDALKRSYLIDVTKSEDSQSTLNGKAQGQLTLDSRIEEGGANLSVGQVRTSITSRTSSGLTMSHSSGLSSA